MFFLLPHKSSYDWVIWKHVLVNKSLSYLLWNLHLYVNLYSMCLKVMILRNLFFSYLWSLFFFMNHICLFEVTTLIAIFDSWDAAALYYLIVENGLSFSVLLSSSVCHYTNKLCFRNCPKGCSCLNVPLLCSLSAAVLLYYMYIKWLFCFFKKTLFTTRFLWFEKTHFPACK